MTTTKSMPNRTFRNASEQVIREAIKEMLIVELPSQTVTYDDIYLHAKFDLLNLDINEFSLFRVTKISLNLSGHYIHIYFNHSVSSSILIDINNITKIRQF